jgi:hypothetical protein
MASRSPRHPASDGDNHKRRGGGDEKQLVDENTKAEVSNLLEKATQAALEALDFTKKAGRRWMDTWAPRVTQALQLLCPPDDPRYEHLWETQERGEFGAPRYNTACLKPGVPLPSHALELVMDQLGYAKAYARRRLSVYFFTDLWAQVRVGQLTLDQADALVPERTRLWKAWNARRGTVPPSGRGNQGSSLKALSGPEKTEYHLRDREELRELREMKKPPTEPPLKKRRTNTKSKVTPEALARGFVGGVGRMRVERRVVAVREALAPLCAGDELVTREATKVIASSCPDVVDLSSADSVRGRVGQIRNALLEHGVGILVEKTEEESTVENDQTFENWDDGDILRLFDRLEKEVNDRGLTSQAQRT